MVINERAGWLVMFAPKTGGTAGHEVLTRAPFNGRRLGGRHEAAVPPEYDGIRVVSFCRCPYLRVVSLYQHFMLGYPGAGGSFPAYCRALAEGSFYDRAFAFYTSTICDWFRQTPVDLWLRLESIDADLRQLEPGWSGPLLRLNETPSTVLVPPLHLADAVAIAQWAAEDFARFNYHDLPRWLGF